MRVGGEGNEVQPITYDLEAPPPLAIGAYTASQPSMLEMPLLDYNNHDQHHFHGYQQQHHHYNNNAMPFYPNALPQGLPGYLPPPPPPPNQFVAGPSWVNRGLLPPPPPPPDQFAAGPSHVNRSMQADPLSFLDHDCSNNNSSLS